MLTNLIIRSCFFSFFSIIFSTIKPVVAQDTPLVVISDWKKYRQQADANDSLQLVELRSLMPTLVYDLRYATKNNFMKRRMYPRSTTNTYLRQPVAVALSKVQQELQLAGYSLKIFDAYRPYAVTVKFWELVGDERYVANPARGSGHNRGIAVDLTIIDRDGKELDMGTDFDDFTDTAHHNFTALPEEVLQNRKLLRETMEKHGFRKYDNEWWHYAFPGAEKFDVLNLDFGTLRKKTSN